MNRNYMAVILSGDNTEEISALTKMRSLASIPVGGSYRIIDFALSNVVNAGIRNVALFCGKEDLRSLTDHIGIGAPWDLARKKDGLFIFRKMLGISQHRDYARVQRNLEYFVRSQQENVILLNANMVCNLDIQALIKSHEASGKEMTMAYKKVEDGKENFHYCSALEIDEASNTVTAVGKNIFFREVENISLDAFIISKAKLMQIIVQSIQDGEHYMVQELLESKIGELTTNAFEFTGELQNIQSTKEYFDFNMKLLCRSFREEVYGEHTGRHIFTKVKDTPPSIIRKTADVRNSLISNGCIVKGKVRNSLLSRGAVIDEGAIVENCVILQDCHVRAGAHLKNVIVDKNNEIEIGKHLQGSADAPLVIEKNLKWNEIKLQELIANEK